MFYATSFGASLLTIDPATGYVDFEVKDDVYGTFEFDVYLEDTSRLSAAHQLKGFWIIEWNVIQVIFHPMSLFDHLTGTRHNR